MAMMNPVTLITAASLLAQPWRNGAGVTREIFATITDQGGLLWRLSLASLDRAAPFSAFDGLDRLFALVAGRVRLDGAEAPFPVTLDDSDAPLAFAGEAVVTGEPLGGQAMALNLMVRRGGANARMVRHAGGPIAAGKSALLIFAPSAVAVHVAGRDFALARHDTLIVGPGYGAAASGPCLWASVALTPG